MHLRFQRGHSVGSSQNDSTLKRTDTAHLCRNTRRMAEGKEGKKNSNLRPKPFLREYMYKFEGKFSLRKQKNNNKNVTKIRKERKIVSTFTGCTHKDERNEIHEHETRYEVCIV